MGSPLTAQVSRYPMLNTATLFPTPDLTTVHRIPLHVQHMVEPENIAVARAPLPSRCPNIATHVFRRPMLPPPILDLRPSQHLLT
ncbi:hypothetical protein FRC11_002765, partial [Ceratobasidium sp. 423]